ncbi:transglycosylase SLT domain-containing protein [Rahnella inusitata]|uniref:transglycosylase SLT domain-containing protein n=1 Tax=Rahnella inusitata TaxID=58169 RepID=UPI001BC84B57|nr:transglycosylase SLT domain-containing protein [Rahnella inusitata]QUT14068.1 transglycosylase SLT domain-containing protein [Rahnella inusitata]
MDAETIKDFLISLGFQIDDAGANKFDSVIVGVTANVFKMAAVVEGAALSVVAFTAKIASGLDNLYWASQRTGATVQGIQQIGYAVSQMGGSVDGARSSLESLSRFMRNSPGAESFLNRLGIQTRDAKGNMRDMATVFTGVGQKLSSMPYYRANQYAQMLGIDENTLLAMRRGLGNFSAQYSQMTKAIGYNADTAAVSANKFMTSLHAFGQMAGMARDKIGSNLAEGLAGSIDKLRKQILDNFPKIEETITRGIKGLLWLADVIGRVVFRLIQAAGDIREWWGTLDKGTQQLITTFGALVVAWRLLNSAFLTSPIGIITTLIGSLVLLYDDYKSWKEGSKSLIDWEKWQPGIEAAKKGLDWFTDKLNDLNTGTLTWKDTLKSLSDFMKGDWSKAITEAINYVNLKFNGFFEEFGRKLANSPFWRLLRKAHIMSDKDTEDMQNFFSGNVGDPGPPDQASQPVQYAQSVRRPHATESGSKLLNLLEPTLNKLEGLYQLPAGLLKSVAITESAGNPLAQSGAGAKGLFQFMDPTARDMGLKGNDVFDPVKSAQAAAKYLSQLMKMNGGDLEKTLASYNWGIGNVQKHGMALMPQETRNYVPKVLSNMPGNQTVSQETNIHIHGVSDPTRAGMEVADRQTGVNSRLAQQVSRGPR